MSYWSPLITAYEADVQVLEEARRAYLKASRSLLEHLRSGISNLNLDGVASADLEEGSSGRELVVAEAPRLRVRFISREGLPVIKLMAWVASGWGGPAASLRLCLALEDLPHPFSAGADRWLRVAHASLPELPGEPYTADRHLDVGEGHWLRIHTVTLTGREKQEILGEVLETAMSYLQAGLQVLDELDRAAAPLLGAYAALADQHTRLLKWARELDVTTSPSREGKLGKWQGRDYLQIGSFWVGIDSAAIRILAEAHLPEAAPIKRLARSVGRPVEERNRYPSLILMNEEELVSRSAHEVIAEAFDTWIAWKRGELARS